MPVEIPGFHGGDRTSLGSARRPGAAARSRGRHRHADGPGPALRWRAVDRAGPRTTPRPSSRPGTRGGGGHGHRRRPVRDGESFGPAAGDVLSLSQRPAALRRLPDGRAGPIDTSRAGLSSLSAIGLSYSRFRYRDLRLPLEARVGDTVEVSAEVENAGTTSADEIVQLYLSAVASQRHVPIRSLAGFQRLTLAPGERRRVTFRIAPERLSSYDEAGHRVEAAGRLPDLGGRRAARTGPGASGDLRGHHRCALCSDVAGRATSRDRPGPGPAAALPRGRRA